MISADVIKNRLRDLQQNEIEINSFLTQVNKKIVEIEESYLAETNLGNIIRGFDIGWIIIQTEFAFNLLFIDISHCITFEIDGKQRVSVKPDDRERLFSCSAYDIWLECKAQQDTIDMTNQEKKNFPPRTSLGTTDSAGGTLSSKSSNPKKKSRKSSSSLAGHISRSDYDPDHGDY